jgi:hypothetical protein
VSREADRANNEWLWTRRQAWSATWVAVRARVEETPTEPKSSGGGHEVEDEDEEEREVTPLPHSLPLEDLPSPGDVFSQQEGASIGERRPKCPQTRTESSSGLSP